MNSFQNLEKGKKLQIKEMFSLEMVLIQKLDLFILS